MFRLVLSLFPTTDSDMFEAHSGAIAVCWSAANELDTAIDRAMEQLEPQGWKVDHLAEAVAGQVRNPEDARLAAEAERQGVYCRVDLRRRMCVDVERNVLTHSSLEGLSKRFLELASEIRINRSAVALFSTADNVLATAQILEQPVFPLWANEATANIWRPDWNEDVSLKRIELAELNEILQEVDDETELVALGFAAQLVTFDPAALWTAVSEPSDSWPLRR